MKNLNNNKNEFKIESKILDRHLNRKAYVYIRQSTIQQVHINQESTAIQYALTERAENLGWKKDQVIVIDEDQGRSGQHTEGRLGFQKLLAEISLDHVGLILGIEMSRLARSCKDWYQLLELCALFHTLLGDQDGVYDPTQYNDRLLLGLKGTMSEAELHIIRSRMNQGRLNKAKRGELYFMAPIGYIRVPNGGMQIDPDEQVQNIVRTVFDKFQSLGSINSLLQYFVKNKMQFGMRSRSGENKGQLEWHRPNRQTIQGILHNPLYAGAYCYGQRPTDPRRKIPGRVSTGRLVKRPEEAFVLIKNHCPSYITWKQYEDNRKLLATNRAKAESMGSPRDGNALLPGLLICGRCGCRMTVFYTGYKKNKIRYTCARDYIDYGEKMCQSFVGDQIEKLVENQILKVLEPTSIELSLKVSEKINKENSKLDNHWKLKLERAKYETERAARQYNSVEPENRLIARELERRWEDTIENQRKLQSDYEIFESEKNNHLTEFNRKRILKLSEDIPKLWNDSLTSSKEKKRIARLLLKQVVAKVEGDSEKLKVQIVWYGGCVSEHEAIRPVAKYEQLSYYPALLDRVEKLYKNGLKLNDIANQLNKEGWHPPKRSDTFNKQETGNLLAKKLRVNFRPKKYKFKKNNILKMNEWWLSDLSREAKIPEPTVHSWIKRGWISAKQIGGPQGYWILWADKNEFKRLEKIRTRKRSWSNEAPPLELTTPSHKYKKLEK